MNREVKASFNLYENLLKERKTLNASSIVLEEKTNNANWLNKSTAAYHETLELEIQFIVESRKDNFKYYGFKLRYSGLCPEPFFRFDSDGPAHRNKCPRIPLQDQLITTPHFNSFDEHGCEIAYKSNELIDLAQAKEIVDDINFGAAHFCHESNTRLNADQFPEVQYPTPLLGLDVDSIDPHDSITFQI